MCSACRHLGLQCEYKRPMWWSSGDARRKHKEDIKNIIKRKKLAEKTSQAAMHASDSSTPSLAHSLPTSATLADSLDRTRSASIDSQFPTLFGDDFGSPFVMPEYDGPLYNLQLYPDFLGNGYSPYEVDVKTERQMFVNDIPTLVESHMSTISSYQPTPPPASVVQPSLSEASWPNYLQQDCPEALSSEGLAMDFFDFASDHRRASYPEPMELEGKDQQLLNHFIHFVLPTLFPILERRRQGSVGADVVLPALQSNTVYRHCCLSIAAQHLKTHQQNSDEEMDQEILRHRFATISSLCESLQQDENLEEILEVALALIFYQTVVGRLDDELLDIAWHQHFQAAVSLVQKLNLPGLVVDTMGPLAQAPFNMTLTSWIDILGATMHGLAPTFAHTYREKHISAINYRLGLRELMGCDDRVMYLISEVACLESLKQDGMDDFTLCQHVSALGEQISLTEVSEEAPKAPYDGHGNLSLEQLYRNLTAAFRIAARIYLCSLVPGFCPGQPSPVGLVEKLAKVLQYIPGGPDGFDRSLVWPFLIGGAFSLPGSSFRGLMENRVAQMGQQAVYGSFGCMVRVVREVWLQSDLWSPLEYEGISPASTVQQQQYVHWRDVMRVKGWDYLLI